MLGSNRRALSFVALILAVPWADALPAAAHEIRIALVTPESAEPDADARRGFLLAVDQSPDVSHPPGPDAGDHLGGVDVEIVTVDTAAGGDAARDRVDDVLDGGVSAVVISAPTPVLNAVSAAADPRGILTIAVAEDGADAPPGSDVVLRALPPDRVDRARLDRFDAEFADAYRRSPTSTAALGYDAGRLLDELIRETGEDLPLDRVPAAARGAADVLVATSLEVPDADVAKDTRAPTSGTGSRGRKSVVPAVAGVGAVGLLLFAAAVVKRRRQS